MDFSRSGGAERRGKTLPLSGIPIYYYLCNQCGYCFAPEIISWDLKKFSEKIYNEAYIVVDPEYKNNRPQANAKLLLNVFKGKEKYIKHLDYGGGNGLLSKLVLKSGWDSSTNDPFVNKDIHDIKDLGQFNLITAFEVFEHVPDARSLMSSLDSLLKEDGLILFSTALSDGNIKKNQRLKWWYASPRNGHISLFSKKSLTILVKMYGFSLGSFSAYLHVLFKQKIPSWAKDLVTIQRNYKKKQKIEECK